MPWKCGRCGADYEGDYCRECDAALERTPAGYVVMGRNRRNRECYWPDWELLGDDGTGLLRDIGGTLYPSESAAMDASRAIPDAPFRKHLELRIVPMFAPVA